MCDCLLPCLAVVVIGFSPVPCRTTEGVEGLSVQVDILVGLLARNLSVLFETVDGTAIGACLLYLLYRLLLFVHTIQHYTGHAYT